MMDPTLGFVIIGAAAANVSALGVAFMNLRGKSLDLSREIRGNTTRLTRIETTVDGIRSDLAAHDGSIRVLNTQIQHFAGWKDDLARRCDVEGKRLTRLERQVNGGSE